MTFTVADTPPIRLRVQRDLDRVVDEVRAADPHLRALVLTGGFARGEGAMMDGRPQNDYDFVAIRGWGRPRRAYQDVRRLLERELRIHVDLATIPAWRLARVAPTIFWYETALRGRVLWGEELLDRIPIRTPRQLDRAEGLRLLVNRAAGLLLVTDTPEAHEHRIQAAKALLAALDAYMLAIGTFPPTQTERWDAYQRLYRARKAPRHLTQINAWLAWAYQFKVDPENAASRDPRIAWQIAANAILDSVPVALQHAAIRSLQDYARRDGFIDHLVYLVRANSVPGARRLVANPTGRVRVATLQLLQASLDGKVHAEAARTWLGPIARTTKEPLRLLDGLRKATLQ
jgi:hypothetical protein